MNHPLLRRGLGTGQSTGGLTERTLKIKRPPPPDECESSSAKQSDFNLAFGCIITLAGKAKPWEKNRWLTSPF